MPAIYGDTNSCNPSVILSQLVCVVDSETRAVFFTLEEINHSMRNKGIEQSNPVLISHRIRSKIIENCRTGVFLVVAFSVFLEIPKSKF